MTAAALAVVAAVAVPLAQASPEERLASSIPGVFELARNQYARLLEEAEKTPDRFPRSLRPDGSPRTDSLWGWTSGFFPGLLWQTYAGTGDTAFRDAAARWTRKFERLRHYDRGHDIGFMLMGSYGLGLRYAPETVPEARDVLLDGARALMRRFSPKVGAIRSWNNKRFEHPVIIDNMMNLELLEWAANHRREKDAGRVARAHADTTLRNHFRPDGSAYHVTDYNPDTGRVFARYAWQGACVDGAWARGQTWAVYGFTMMCRETGDTNYLAAARRTADFVMNHPNLPADAIPCWDFCFRDGDGEPRDASAAAVLASALLEMGDILPADEGARYRAFAVRILNTLCSDAYLAKAGENGFFLLRHSTGHKPENSEVDTPISYADYYFLEALLRFREIRARDRPVCGGKPGFSSVSFVSSVPESGTLGITVQFERKTHEKGKTHER